MKHITLHAITLLAAATLGCEAVQAQARGPAAEDVQQHGQVVLSRAAREEIDRENDAALDDATRAARVAEVAEWLKRLPGRYRIKGQVLRTGQVEMENGRPVTVPLDAMQGAGVTGIADCGEVGEGAAIQCALTAVWPFFEDTPLNQSRLPPAEKLNSMKPAVLFIGLSQDPPGIRAMLVPADSLAHVWVGKLDEDSTKAYREISCFEEFDRVPDRCLELFEVIARPDSDIVTLQFYATEGVSLQFILRRDPNAKADGPVRSLKSR